MPTIWPDEGDLEGLFHRYNEAAKEQGFRMMKSLRKTSGGNEYAVMVCFNGKGSSQISTRKWKAGAGNAQKAGGGPCRARVVFEMDPMGGGWVRRELLTGHSHDPDPTLLTNA